MILCVIYTIINHLQDWDNGFANLANAVSSLYTALYIKCHWVQLKVKSAGICLLVCWEMWEQETTRIVENIVCLFCCYVFVHFCLTEICSNKRHVKRNILLGSLRKSKHLLWQTTCARTPWENCSEIHDTFFIHFFTYMGVMWDLDDLAWWQHVHWQTMTYKWKNKNKKDGRMAWEGNSKDDKYWYNTPQL